MHRTIVEGKFQRNLLRKGLLAAMPIIAMLAFFAAMGTASAESPGAISGTVTQSGGGPISGVAVFVNDFDSGAAAGSAATAGDGTYLIANLTAGKYRVKFDGSLVGFPIQFYDGKSVPKDATAVTVSAGATTTSINASLVSGGSVEGKVTKESDGSPVVNADVWAEAYDGGVGSGTTTAADGTFEILGLQAGGYRVAVEARGQGLVFEFYNNTSDWDKAQKVIVTNGTSTTGINFALAGGSAISGVVLKDGSGAPVADADVFAESFTPGGGHGGTRTASDGTYSIGGLAAGDYRVFAQAGDQSLAGEFYNDTPDWEKADPVTLVSGTSTIGINFSLAGGGSISGTIVSANGKATSTPLEGVHVFAEREQGGGGNGSMTGPDGKFVIDSLPAGKYRVGVHAPDLGLAHQFYDNQTEWHLADLVDVTSASTTAGINFALSSGGTISGTVTDSVGNPVGRVFVHASSYNTGDFGGGTNTRDDGTYEIRGLRPGSYRVETWVPDDISLAREFYNDTADWDLATPVNVTKDGTTPDIDFSLATGGAITGKVTVEGTGKAVRGADVWAESFDIGGGGSGARTDQNGEYTLNGLTGGDYRVMVFVPHGNLAGEIYNNATTWDTATRVTVTNSSTTPAINFELAGGGSITGKVLIGGDGKSAGSPVSGADVWAESYNGGGGNGTRTRPDGSYAIDGLAPGDYRVAVFAGNQGLTFEFYNGTSDWDKAEKVEVKTGTSTKQINFNLSQGGSIEGIITKSSDGSPVSGVDVWAHSFDGPGGGNGTRSRSDGTYEITGLTAGDYRVGVHVQGKGLSGGFYENTADWDKAKPVTVASGTSTKEIDFALTGGGSVSGMVVIPGSKADTPVAGADVWAERYDGGGGNGTRTRKDGTYEIDGLPAGDYRVQVFVPGKVHQFYNNTGDWDKAERVKVTQGTTTTDIDFSLAEGGKISGKVINQSTGLPVNDADVWANGYDTGGGNGTRTHADGTYVIDGLAAGDYRVQVHAPHLKLVGEFYDNETDWGKANRVTVQTASTTGGIDFALVGGGSLSGRVTLDDGSKATSTPVANADVWADNVLSGGGHGTRTDKDGYYTIDGLAAGKYRVFSQAHEQDLAGEFYDNTNDWDKATQVVVSPGTTTPNIDFSLGGGGAITGTVTKDSDGSPVANVDVFASSYDGGGGNGTRTDGSGNYTIKGLPADDYRVQVHTPPDRGLTDQFYDNTNDWSAAKRVTVSQGTTTAGIDFSLGSGGSISGRVMKENGSKASIPVPGADVWAQSYNDTGAGNGGRTDKDGYYFIGGLPPGDFRVQAHSHDQGLVGEFYDNTTDWGQAAKVNVKSSTTTTGIDFLLGGGGKIKGKVTRSSDGSPIEHANVNAFGFNGGGGSFAQTDASGEYVMNVAPGTYRVEVNASHMGFASQFYDGTSDWSAAKPVIVTSGNETDKIDFSLGAGGTISGTIVDSSNQPLADVDVFADSFGGGGGGGNRTDSNGEYTIEGLAPGNYRVGAHAPHLGFASQFYDKTSIWDKATPVTVTSGTDTPDIDFVLAAGGAITGRVVKVATGAGKAGTVVPVANADVWAQSYDGAGGGGGSRTRADGTYKITGLAPGGYRVQASAPHQGLIHQYYKDTSDWDKASNVTVNVGTTTANIDFTLAGGGSISGRVTSAATGQGIPGAQINAFNESGGNGTQSGADGSYWIDGLAAGKYRIEANAPGFAAQYFDNVAEWDKATLVEVVVGQNKPNHNFSLGAGGAIAGTIYQSNGVTPIVGAHVHAEPSQGGGGNSTMSGPLGRYKIESLAPGDYRIDARAPGYASQFYFAGSKSASSTLVRVKAGETAKDIDFKLEKGGSIEGTVYEANGSTPIPGAFVHAEMVGNGFGGDAHADVSGHYRIDSLPPGQYRVEARAAGFAQEFYDESDSEASSTAVTVNSTGTTQGIDFTLAGGGAIEGSVFKEDGTTPIGGAWVFASLNTGGAKNGVGRGAGTEPDGSYRIDGLPAGDYTVAAHANGYETQYYDESSTTASSTAVTVVTSSTTDEINFTMSKGAGISGKVTQVDGTTPVHNVPVLAWPVGTGWPPESDPAGGADSQSDGSYTITGLAPGSYWVLALGSDLGWVMEFWEETDNPASTTAVVVPSGTVVTGVDFTLTAGGSISGRVVRDVGGPPPPSIEVLAFSIASGRVMGSDEINSNGDYQIKGLPSGSYMVVADDEAEQYDTVWYNGVSDPASSTPVTVQAPNNMPNINFTVKSTGGGSGGGATAEGKIRGTVFREDGSTPLPGIAVSVMPAGGQKTGGTGGPPMVMSQPDGKFELKNLPSGDYIVFASSTGFVTEYWEETENPASSTPVTVSSTSTPEDIDFTLSFFGGEGATITGIMIGSVKGIQQSKAATGTVSGIANATVSATPLAGGPVRNATTNVSGDYVLPGLTPGDYEVRAMAAGYLVEWWEEVNNSASSTPVTVASTTLTGINFTLDLAPATSSNGFIEGTVRDDSSGSPISRAMVKAKPLSGGPDHTEITDASGDYSFDIAPGNHLVSAVAPGYAVEYYDDSPTIGGAITVTVTASSTTTGIDFALSALSGGTSTTHVFASGRVTGPPMGKTATGTVGIANATVSADPGSGGTVINATTDSNGDYELTGMTPGDYEIRAMAAGYLVEWWQEANNSASSTHVTVNSSTTVSGIDFTLALASSTSDNGFITGRVTDASSTDPIAGATVTATPLDGGPDHATTTNSLGEYTFDIAPGPHRVSAVASRFAVEYYNESATSASSTDVNVTASTTTSGIDFTLEALSGGGTTTPKGIMTGRVTEQASSTVGIPNATVSAEPLSGGGPVRNANTDSNGDYFMGNLDPGSYTVRAMAAGFEVEWWMEVGNSASSTNVVISGGATTTGINFTLDVATASSSNGFITGAVTNATSGAPIHGAMVYAKPLAGGPEHSTTTDILGQYSFDIAPGPHMVRAAAFGFALEYYSESETIASSTEVVVASSTTESNIDFTLAVGSAISGTVVEQASTSTPITTAKVTVTRTTGAPYSRTVNVNSAGFYKVTNLPLGSYTVKAEAGGFTEEWWQEAATLGAATAVAISPGVTSLNINFTLS
ncbi:MAG: carboxypeptidase regulatory-like domain-containing protein [SAR202 cluster bacterium]|nr:carboxypeptidase regulatory-like domain-containing protein [SAR202 cluster bacterium]